MTVIVLRNGMEIGRSVAQVNRCDSDPDRIAVNRRDLAGQVDIDKQRTRRRNIRCADPLARLKPVDGAGKQRENASSLLAPAPLPVGM